MTLNITMPQLNGSAKSTKDKVVSILSNKWPLSAKEIYNTLQREHATEVSYQAVHKILNELQGEKILEKNGKSYQISKQWIQQVKRFGSELEEKYTNDKKIDFEHFESMHLVFDRYIDFCRFLINEFIPNFPNASTKDSACFWKHVIAPIGITGKEHEHIKKFLSDSAHYAPCKHNTFLDNWFAKYLNDLGKKCINGVKLPVNTDTFIQGDYIMQAFYTTKLTKNIDRLYNKVKSMKEFELSNYFEIINEKNEVNILITKNSSLADKLREEAKRIYKKQHITAQKKDNSI